jgi:hypothetical protein
MTEHTASRTLVKSPPELWAECSDATALTRHLDRFGDIKITRLEPETAVAWEGEQVRGTVRLEPSGWGTKVTLTAMAEGGGAALARVPVAVAEPVVEPVLEPEPPAAASEPEPEPEPAPAAEPATAVEPAPAPAAKRPGMLSRLLAKLVGSAEPEPELVLQELTAESPPPEVVAPRPEVAVKVEVPVVPEVQAQPEVVAEPEPEPEPASSPLAAELADAEAALVAALDSLGQAHHRPFSRG